MDKETILNQFEKIENKIEELINAKNGIEAENIELRKKNNELEYLLQEKIDFESRNEELKTVVRTKLDSLIGRLEGFTEQ